MPEDIEQILLGLYPAKVMLKDEDLDIVPRAFAAFLRFLGDERILGPRLAASLAEQVDGLAEVFRVEAKDERNWSTGKRLWRQAGAEGVEFGDSLAMEQFIEAFNARPFEERDAILDGRAPSPSKPLPPTVLAPRPVLATAAQQTTALTRIRALVDFLSPSRQLTKKGNLKLADGKALIDILATDDQFDRELRDQVFKTKSTTELMGVDRTFRLALACDFVEVAGSEARPGSAVADLDDRPLEAAFNLFQTVLFELGPSLLRWQEPPLQGADSLKDEFHTHLTELLFDLYRHGIETIPDMIEDSWENLNRLFDFDELDSFERRLEHSSVGWAMWRSLDRLAELGVIQLGDIESSTNRYGTVERTDGTTELTELGKWMVHRIASRYASVPVIGELRDAPATDLLTAAADLSQAQAVAEVQLWIDDHGKAAADLLAAAIPQLDATARRIGIAALVDIGQNADVAIEGLIGDPQIEPIVAVLRGDAVDSRGDAERFVLLVNAALDLHGPEEAGSVWADRAAEPFGLLETLSSVWRVRLPETEDVLASIGGHHPDQQVAKEARKALFKHRTTG